MHSRYFCIIVIILQLTHPNLAVPFTSPNLYGLPLERHADRANVPNHKHGTPLSRRNPGLQADIFATSTSPPISRRSIVPVCDTKLRPETPPLPLIIAAPGTSTYTEVTYEYQIEYHQDNSDPLHVLYDAGTGVNQHLAAHQDGPITGGAMNFEQDDMILYVENANNHQVTWGVLGATVETLQDYVRDALLLCGFGWAAISFAIYDGLHQVGRGYLKHS
ncbi:MAG: hypothetical protein FRX48_02506 [Lasallia pustulata]|uniref:Uncharacterized protein n=1 Tax=Lasallia pustulata TaxID=136370 RepID=A0A5M8PYK8_9LECA|nr:MAG: hypothetical protein FRX48_02506 [Lasallia pustulata]